MTRQVLDVTERARLASDVAVSVRVLVLDDDAVWRELRNLYGVNWIKRVEISATIDDAVASLALVLVREGTDTTSGQLSIAPQISASPANRNAALAFAPLLNPARRIRVLTATVPYGQDPDANLASDKSAPGWSLEAGWTLDSSGNGLSGALTSFKHVASANAAARPPAFWPCVPGELFSASGFFKGVSGANGSAFVRLEWYNASHAEISGNNGTNAASDGTYHSSTVQAAAPALAAYVRAEYVVNGQSAGSWYAEGIFLTRGAIWKRVFDGKIDGVDPAAGRNTMTLRGRDRGAWLLNTWIEGNSAGNLITYGSAIGTPIESVVQSIINDNAVPFGATLDVPDSPDFNLGLFEQEHVSVMEAIRTLGLLQGADIRWIFPFDGDSDPVLRYGIPERDKTVPDWTFGPGEYLEIPRAPISDDDIRNAVTIEYYDTALASVQRITRINSASITAFGRRWGKYVVANPSLLDSDTEAAALGDAIVNDLGSPPIEHEMRTFYFWPISLGDLCRFTHNDVHYDQDQSLAAVGYTHVFEGGKGYTTIASRGTPAGAYREWLALASVGAGPGGTFPSIVGVYEIVSQTTTQIVVRLSGTAPGTTRLPAVRINWLGITPPISKIAGAAVGAYVASGSEWTFAKPTPGSGDGAVGFGFSLSGYSDTVITVPIPEATAATGPTVNTPTFVVNVDPTNSFQISWTVASAPAGATYKAYWRIGTGGAWQVKSAGTSLTVTILNTEHGHVIGSSGGTVRAFQSYVEMDSSGGGYLAQSAIGSVNFNDLGLG